ncbi:DUF2188 domain-containing protein [Polyangium spumosum]|uniref:DUF2188 domain-containing protein n=1 Tax=Polyangium spumosum TaxID=889282 RepID=A0A6N7PQ54_9BACT|nr:DUF2188 domain-containing protein [Polyangium spumosum]MRG94188.1 DUF2188 domain-containing protein [Polyangium spumosum]
MARAFVYHVAPDPDGWGWVVAAEGYHVHSLPYGTSEEAIEVAEGLARKHPGSTIVVDLQPTTLSAAEIEYQVAA